MAVARALLQAPITHLRRRIPIIFGATAVFAVLSTLVVYVTEHGAKGTEIHRRSSTRSSSPPRSS